MGDFKKEYSMSKHEALVYKVFQQNQKNALSVKDVELLLKRENPRLSTRTIYRIIEKFQHKKIIYCTDMQKGVRYFHLVEDYRIKILCRKCGWTAMLDDHKIEVVHQMHNGTINSVIIGGKIIFNGICHQCRQYK
ncbi:MAG: transcriptional repressor [Bacillota bacterium]